MTDSISQAIILTMMDKIVVYAMPFAPYQPNCRVRKRGYFTIVNSYSIKLSDNPPRDGKLIIIIPSKAIFPKGTLMVFHMALRIGALNTQPGNAHIRPLCPDKHRRV